jgi:hypothetical protein
MPQQNEPEDARPKWLDPDAQDAVPDDWAVPDSRSQLTPPGLRAEMGTWRSMADVRERQRAQTRENYERTDPERMALHEMISADESGQNVDYRQLHATRAAAWASLAVLRELRAHHRPR